MCVAEIVICVNKYFLILKIIQYQNLVIATLFLLCAIQYHVLYSWRMLLHKAAHLTLHITSRLNCISILCSLIPMIEFFLGNGLLLFRLSSTYVGFIQIYSHDTIFLDVTSTDVTWCHRSATPLLVPRRGTAKSRKMDMRCMNENDLQ